MSARIHNHIYCLNAANHRNDHLQKAWNKYGETAFESETIVECNEDDLIWIEQVYLDWYWDYGVLYNINPRADRIEFTDEVREKIRLAASRRTWNEEERRKLSEAQKTANHPNRNGLTEEHKRNIGLGNLGKRRTKEERIRICEGHATKLTADDVRDIHRLWNQGNLTQTEIAKKWSLSQSYVCQIVNKKRWSHI